MGGCSPIAVPKNPIIKPLGAALRDADLYLPDIHLPLPFTLRVIECAGAGALGSQQNHFQNAAACSGGDS
jgi:hypothetical protein